MSKAGKNSKPKNEQAMDDVLDKAAEAAIDKNEQENIRSQKAKGKYTQVIEEGYTSLGATLDMDDRLNDIRNWMSSLIVKDGFRVPRFGVLSMIIQNIPIALYDNDVMNKITKTAFTDGFRIFLSVDLFEKLIEESEQSNLQEKGVPFLILHEASHVLLKHVSRHSAFNGSVANFAEDLIINPMLEKMFPDVSSEVLRETGIGFAAGEAEKYEGVSDDEILHNLIMEKKKSLKQSKKKSEESGGEPGSGGGGGAGGSGAQEDGAQGDGDPQKGDGPPSGFGEDGDVHHIQPEDLEAAMEEGGMDISMEAMGMTQGKDGRKADAKERKDAIEGNKRLNDARMDNLAHEAQEQMAKVQQGGGQYPGGDMVTHANDIIKASANPKLRFTLATRDAIMNNSSDINTTKISEDTPNDMYYVDEITDMLGMPVYIEAEIPDIKESLVLCVVDISGSMGDPDVVAGVSEMFALKSSATGLSDKASEVVIVMGDTQIRGDAVTLTESNFRQMAEEGLVRPACGGTDLANVLSSAMELDEVKEKNIRSVIFITDSYDTPPKFEDLGIERDTAIVYAVVPSSGIDAAERFAAGVKDYARVVYLDEHMYTDVDLTENFLSKMSASPTEQRSRGKKRRAHSP